MFWARIFCSFWLFGCVATGGFTQEFCQAQTVELILLEADSSLFQALKKTGTAAEVRPGDLLFRNQHLTVVIAQPEIEKPLSPAAETPCRAGGLVYLSTTQSPQNLLQLFLPGAEEFSFSKLELLSDSGLPLAAEKLPLTSFSPQEVRVLFQDLHAPVTLTVVYRLDPDLPYLSVRKTYENAEAEEGHCSANDLLLLNRKHADLRHPVWSRRPWREMFGVEDVYAAQAYGFIGVKSLIHGEIKDRQSLLSYRPFPLPSGAEGETSENHSERNWAGATPILMPQGKCSQEVHCYAGYHLADVQAQRAAAEFQKLGHTVFTVSAGEEFLPQARVELKLSGEYYGSLWTDGSGRIDQKLRPGPYLAEIFFQGLPQGKSRSFQVKEGYNFQDWIVPLEIGTCQMIVRDEQAELLPARVQWQRPADLPPLHFGPRVGTTGTNQFRQLISGQEEILLPVGDYEIEVSHGPEFQTQKQSVSIKPRQKTQVKSQLARAFSTEGWTSVAFPSGPSGELDFTERINHLSTAIRLWCEGVEFTPGFPVVGNRGEETQQKWSPQEWSQWLSELNLAIFNRLPVDLEALTEPEGPWQLWLKRLSAGEQVTAVVAIPQEPQFVAGNLAHNWVRTDRQQSGSVQNEQILSALKAGQVILSNGPFLSLAVSEADPASSENRPAGPGETCVSESGEVEVAVRVQCTAENQIDRVVLLLNGQPLAEHDYSRRTTPQRFQAGTTPFEHHLKLRFSEKSHLIVMALGESASSDVEAGTEAEAETAEQSPALGKPVPIAISNPVFLKRSSSMRAE